MATVATAQEFLSLLAKSHLLDPPILDTYLRACGPGHGAKSNLKRLTTQLVANRHLTLFQVDQLVRGKWQGFMLGRYRVLEPLGAGGMGTVFLCDDTRMRRQVAVKILGGPRRRDPARQERFARETRAIAALDHPNVVHAFDVDRDGERYFLVMEHIDGISLSRLVKPSRPLSPLRACHYIRQAALGLQHAFEAGLVHRDVKPSNLMLDRDGCIKVLDLGLARFFDDDQDDLTERCGEGALGTVDYIAPEAVIDFHQADVRADIYGLGATFYFLLTGRPPLPEGSAIEKLQWLQKQRPTSISQYRQDVPPALIAIVEKMMAKIPGKRYPTPAAVATVLSKWTVLPIPPPTVQELSGAKPKLSAAPARRMKAERMTVQRASLSAAPTRRHLSLPVRWRLTLSYLLLVIPIGLLVWLIYRLVGLP